MKKDKTTNANQRDIEDELGLGSKTRPKLFMFLRYLGWLFIAVSAVFLLQRTKPPLIVLGNTAFDNESLGEVLLLIGIILFGAYLANRVYSYFKS